MELPELAALIAGWLVGTLSPGVVAAIAKPKRRKQLLAALNTEAHETRYKLALVAHRVRGKYGTFDPGTLALIKPIVLSYSGFETDEGLASSFKVLLARGEDVFIQAHQLPEQPTVSIWPVPYALPLLDAHMVELSSFSVELQALFLRIRAEVSMYNEQVDYVRTLHERTFETLSPDNFRINQGNLVCATKTLGHRAEITVKTINKLTSATGQLL
jgi:hypothetical protein